MLYCRYTRALLAPSLRAITVGGIHLRLSCLGFKGLVFRAERCSGFRVLGLWVFWFRLLGLGSEGCLGDVGFGGFKVFGFMEPFLRV